MEMLISHSVHCYAQHNIHAPRTYLAREQLFDLPSCCTPKQPRRISKPFVYLNRPYLTASNLYNRFAVCYMSVALTFVSPLSMFYVLFSLVAVACLQE
jgi:hypothetical protein